MTERTVRHRDNGPNGYRGHGVVTRPGEERTVDTETADILLETGYFEAVDDAATDTDTDSGDTETTEMAEPEDGSEWNDWNEDDWFELDFQDREVDVREGRVDAHLDAIESVERSDTVIDAVADRRGELLE